jgi:uncharacterized protein YlxW (UPF0749 family)
MPDTDQAPPTGVRRLLEALRRPHRTQAVIAVALALVGFGAVTQVRANVDDASYTGYREQDLINLLSGLSDTSQRAQSQLDSLTRTRQQLESSTNQRQAALNQAQSQINSLSVLAGTVPVTGPGVNITITEQTGQVTVNNFLDLIEELRTNGAEAMDLNGTRIVAQSSFDQAPDGLVVDGKLIKPPYKLKAIGEPGTLEAAVNFTRGPADELRGDGAQVRVEQADPVDIRSTVATGGTTNPSPQ